MEPKKNPKYDLNRKYFLHLNIGFIFALAFCIAAFEWKTYYEVMVKDLDSNSKIIDITTLPPVHTQEELTPPPPPKVPDLTRIQTVDNDNQIDKLNDLLKEPLIVEPNPGPDVPTGPIAPDAPTGDYVKPDIEDIIFDSFALETQPAGQEDFFKHINKHLKYPREAEVRDVEGKVFVQFVIDKDGSITDVEVIKSLGFGCDEEAIRVIKNAPKWTPGKQRGKPVKVRMMVPITFKLNN